MTNPAVRAAMKACPFCGGKADPEGWLASDTSRGPECEDCGATAESVEDWNRREYATDPRETRAKVLETIGSDIAVIMETYREQDSSGFIDTPGGLEHMGDVWRLLSDWDEALRNVSESHPEPIQDPRDALIGTDVSDSAIADEESRLDALAEAEIEGCDRRGHHAGWTPQPSDYASAATTPYRAALRESKATIARLSGDLEAAREALEPFVPVNDLQYSDDKPVVLKFYDGKNCETIVPFGVWGAFRRARAVLAKLSKGE